MKNKRILELVNQYNSLTDLGKAFEGWKSQLPCPIHGEQSKFMSKAPKGMFKA
jgi:hypothetical protein